MIFLFLLLRNIFFSFCLSKYRKSCTVIFLILLKRLSKTNTYIAKKYIASNPMEIRFKEINITFGIPSIFTMTNDTNWLNKNPKGIDNTNATKNLIKYFPELTNEQFPFSLSQEACKFLILCFAFQT